MESRHLSGLLSSHLNAALNKAREDFSGLIHDVNIIAGQVGKSYRFGGNLGTGHPSGEVP